jgi:putative pyruvate formate lyase activating enzyme
VDRVAGEVGVCRIGRRAVVASYGPHFGEEAPLVGSRGSGTIFFSGCNLRCLFCQNSDISQSREGAEVSPERLAAVMLDLQRQGCHNLNFVTPTHVVPQLLEAVELAAGEGLRLPLVYNCGGYESLATLRLLDGVVDIYMPDAKYDDAAVGERLSGAPNYPAVNRAALAEMHRQVGDLALDERGVAVRGLLVRHLVLPENLAGTAGIMAFLGELSRNTYVNVMAQYRPCHRAYQEPILGRRPTPEEYAAALRAAREAGLTRLDGASPRGAG